MIALLLLRRLDIYVQLMFSCEFNFQDEDTLAVTSSLLQRRAYKDLADFDNHLDDLALDYLNVAINMEIEKLS